MRFLTNLLFTILIASSAMALEINDTPVPKSIITIPDPTSRQAQLVELQRLFKSLKTDPSVRQQLITIEAQIEKDTKASAKIDIANNVELRAAISQLSIALAEPDAFFDKDKEKAAAASLYAKAQSNAVLDILYSRITFK